MFSQVFFCPQGLSFQTCITYHMARGVYIQGGLSTGASASRGESALGDLHPGGLPTAGGGVSRPPRTRKVGGTHPTGIYSFFLLIFFGTHTKRDGNIAVHRVVSVNVSP